jgi:predicted lipoprotein
MHYNMNKKFILPAAAVLIALAAFQACTKSNPSPNGGGGTSSTGFNRASMLTNLSTNIIVPGYVGFQASVSKTDSLVTVFNASTTLSNLTALQTAFKDTYLKWQAVSVFDFGPAGTENLRISVNTFPADVNQINTNISTGTYNLASLSTLPAEGLPGMDYLLFGTGTDNNAILTAYTTDALAAKRKTYLSAISAIIKTKATNVLNAWKSTYPATFIGAAGTDVGSSVGLLTNELNQDFEVLKNYEIGIPAGIQSMGTPFPTKVQAYYSQISLQLAVAHLQTIQNIYLGVSAQGDGLSFDDYLVSAKATYNNGSLSDAIKAQFVTALADLNALSNPLSAQITTNLTAVTSAYTALQQQTVLLKTDMPSALGILITYGDTDGD